MKKRTKENKSSLLNKEEKQSVVNVNDSTEVKSESIKTENVDIEKIESDLTKILFFQRKQKNNLLGEFKDGQYEILDKDILEKLIKIPKKYENQDGQTIYLSSKLDIFVLNFKIDIDVSYSFCNAKLSIIEIENGAVEDIKHTTELERVVEDYALGFREKIFKKWGVYFDDEQIAKDDFLHNYLRLQHEDYLFNKDLVAILSQLYLLRMLKLFDNMGEIGEKLKQEFQMMMEERLEKNPSLSLDFIFQKELLDYIIKKNDALLKILNLEEGRKIINAYLAPLGNIKDKKFENITESIRKEEKKEKKVSADSVIKWGSTLSKNITKPCPKIDLKKLFGNSDKLAEPPAFKIEPITDAKRPSGIVKPAEKSEPVKPIIAEIPSDKKSDKTETIEEVTKKQEDFASVLDEMNHDEVINAKSGEDLTKAMTETEKTYKEITKD